MKKVKMADPRTARVSDLKPGQYVDGSPLDDIQYLECKLILKTDEFTSPKGFRKYARLIAQAAEECGVGFDTTTANGARPAIRWSRRSRRAAWASNARQRRHGAAATAASAADF